MSWELGFDEEDAFFPGGFADTSFSGETSFESPAPFFGSATPTPGPPSVTPASRPPVRLDRDGQSLADENAQLRRTALSLGEKFAQIASLNERLKDQLEECRSKFRSAVCAGFLNTRK